MEIKLDKKPKKPRIIEGFPGFGLIGTISTEFLIDHLKAQQIGSFTYDELPATVAIHKEKLVDPMGIFYIKDHNLVIFHTILNSVGLEWRLSKSISKMAKELQSPEIICLEGVSSPQVTESKRVFYYCTDAAIRKKVKDIPEIEPLKESIIVGVTGALMLRSKIPVTAFFGETHTELPDSKAASNIIKALDIYLKLKVDYKPLLKQAEDFEKKFRDILKQSVVATKQRDKKQMSYLG
ncbi:proteasome assembly chaperone family protein [Candidatus Woesearchaeota archaeon]|nr:proteasome assembly chaperone family protein [Candidatus Woesearchaeota archaeon]